MVYHASAGKKTMGTASPGKSSGNFMSSGNDMETGIITRAKENMENIKLKTISPFRFSQVMKAQFRKAARKQIRILRLIIRAAPRIAEKSA